MTAPALITLAHGSRDPRSAATIKALVGEVRALRPDLRIETAFLDLAKPSLDTVVLQIAAALDHRGEDEHIAQPQVAADLTLPVRGPWHKVFV